MLDLVVELQSGLIRGTIEKHEDGFDYYTFKGIPYAEPPIGDLRFKDPLPIRKWTEVKNCQHYGSICLQYDIFSNVVGYNEDCLHLNAFTKVIDKAKANTPVMVVIHGGAFMFGSSNDSYCGPEYLIREDLVLVTVNYRLGVLGFLNLGDEVATGNQGLKDLILSLQWVQENIHIFGGNPDNVTLLGFGSGGIAAHLLALVISQSALMHHTWYKVYNPKSSAIKLCSMLGKELTESEEIINFLRNLDTVVLQEAQERIRQSMNGLSSPSGPGIDDKSSEPVLPLDLETLQNQGVHLPYLTGYNSHEGILLLLGMSRKDFFQICDIDFGNLFKYHTKDLLYRYNLTEAQIRRLYYKSDVASDQNLQRFIDLGTEFFLLEPVHRFLRIQAEQSSAATYFYNYSYDFRESISRKIMDDLPHGVSHLDELPMLFKMRILEKLGIDYLKKRTRPYKMMEKMTKLWANFAKYGHPTISTNDLIPVHWLPINDGTVLRYLNLDEDITMQSTINLDQKFKAARNIKI